MSMTHPPAGNPLIRPLLSLLAIGSYLAINRVLYPVATIGAADMAGRQLANSDVGAVTAAFYTGVFSNLGVPAIVLAIVLLAIWWPPLRRWFAGLTALAVLVSVQPGWAYYDKADYTEAYTILPNETGFWIPDAGANRDSQTQFESEAYLAANRIALKRFIVPHTKLPGSGSFLDFYVPAGRLIIVDRTPFSREWVDAADRGTSRRHEGFPCQSKEGLNIAVGISIGASVTEANAARYLYHFGVLPPSGDRGDPKTIFNSVYYSRKVADVMDDVGRKKVQTLVCSEIASRGFDQDNAEAVQIMESVQKKAAAYFADVGITLDFIGWADTFTFDPPVQQALDRRYVATQDQAIAALLAPYAGTIQALAAAEALRAFGQRTDGRLPGTIVGLPPSVGPLLETLLKTATPPAGTAVTGPAH